MEQRQLLTRIWVRTERKLSSLIEQAALKRDAYLDRVLAHEAEALLREIPEANSRLAHDFLKRKIRELPTSDEADKHERIKKTNLTVSQRTFELIDAACTERNIPRDCFINRVILMLVGGRGFYAQLLEDNEFDSYVLGPDSREEFYGGFHLSSIEAIDSVVNDDPFRGIRYLIECANQQKADKIKPLLAIPVGPWMFKISPPPEALYGLNCWLPDDYIPGTEAYRQKQGDIDQLLDSVWGT